MKRILNVLVICAATMLLAAGFAAEKPAVENQVTIDNFSFSPQSVTIHAGDSVTWTNKDDVPHLVVSTTKAFRSGVLDTDGRFCFKFDRPGTYDYFCSMHPRMTGKIVVK